ncbi:ubiquitin-protein ligase, putative [Pediculus humanus corporis]|uniref:Ubiquitin-protein ligase E3B n=1 Tax=Pediculus humanus subsp. corporis TaxID=121224 RepID=E0VIW0_PEDHC|nr:ubiquitin-protein ligase, putative [Pediculus humanus corporis]EEB13316.1 ubiquitin-protein ligase, putative [Pediculus humanus corporis]
MFSKEDSQKGCFLEQTKAAREERANEKKRENLIISLQAHIRGWHFRKKFTTESLKLIDDILPKEVEDKFQLKPALTVFNAAQQFLYVWNPDRDLSRFENLCRYIVSSLESSSKDLNYSGLILVKEKALHWITHIKKILKICCSILETLRPEIPSDTKLILIYLHTLVAFTGIKTWQFLNNNKFNVVKPGLIKICSNIVDFLVTEKLYRTLKILLLKGLGRNKIALKNVSLTAIVTLSTLPLINSDFSNKMMTMFLIEILSIPGLILHIDQLAPDCLCMIEKHKILVKTTKLLNNEQNTKIIFNALEGNYALCLLGNIIHLCYIERESTLNEFYFPEVTFILTRIMESCQQYVATKQSNLTHWHPILGWFAQNIDSNLQDAVPHVKSQLHLLWSYPIVKIMLGSPLQKILSDLEMNNSISPTNTPRTATNILKRVVENRGGRNSSTKALIKLGGNECSKMAHLCALYQTALRTFTQLKLDILTGLCYQDQILYNLWRFFGLFGSNYGSKAFLELLTINPNCTFPHFLMLQLFCDCMTHYVIILDDLEMFTQQKPFRLSDFVAMSSFLNNFLYKALLQNLFDVKNLNLNPLFQSMHTLLLVLYRRDCRRNYTPDNHWLIKDIKVCTFISDLEKGKKNTQALLQKMPHIIPHFERVQLFRKYISNEKAVYGLTESACASPHSTLITVHRKRIVEDGYRQLALLPSRALKGVIRVRFVNEQGLDEAGIDQDGVFKEFLEETIKRVFNPSLNLFRVTSEERLYPSPTSHLQDHHLQLFEFVGRMLGKAVYEGIVVDVPFASFFLSQLLGQQHQALYSSIDELPSLDQDLYRSLTFIKHHQGDVQELDLTFSVDEDYLGKIVTHELVPGGKAIPVTNENKINYIHLMSHFRMHTQIKDQTAAFIRGFRSLINPEWLSLFSTPELQRLISGDNVPLDLKDLRKHTQYYGGFHDSHRVVGWLWDILDKDFNEEEKRLFLKFVTSCSKPPLLGFAHLEPPFSIRCVEVGDDEDTGDTIGSVIRGFFTIRKKGPQNRLPTSSTCFNLLKLPNYQKKSTLREKLRYAVSSNTGFELS